MSHLIKRFLYQSSPFNNHLCWSKNQAYNLEEEVVESLISLDDFPNFLDLNMASKEATKKIKFNDES